MIRHKLGTYAGGVAGMLGICDVLSIHSDPDSTFKEYSSVVADDLNGKPIEAGFPTATWTWPVMPQADFDRLLDYLGGASSVSVYIRTRNNSGASGFDFANYLAVMRRPVAEQEGLLRNRVVIEFTGLVLQS